MKQTTINGNRPIAVVTGAAGGIGSAVASEFHKGGYSLALLDLDLAKLEEVSETLNADGLECVAVECDVSDANNVEQAYRQVAKRLGSAQVLVNNAGITRDDLLFRMSEDEWDKVINVHLRGTFLVTRAFQRGMVSQRNGRIINISSVAALGNRGQVNYSAAKAGINGFTKTASIELGPFGITVNSIAPGFIVSDMTRASAARVGLSFEQYSDQVIESIAVRRAGTPEDVAAVARFLASEEAGYVSGQVVYVAGGPTV
ncbi:MAG: SDR family oxidoreductase [Alcaligenaceae bacterium]|nr:MAG: SDR family oxidoreductase [Alcaligenaceae bacterium]